MFSVTVSARGKDRQATLTQLTERAAELRSALDDYPDAIERRETGGVQIYPEVKRGSQRVSAYTGSVTTTVTVTDFTMLGEMLLRLGQPGTDLGLRAVVVAASRAASPGPRYAGRPSRTRCTGPGSTRRAVGAGWTGWWRSRTRRRRRCAADDARRPRSTVRGIAAWSWSRSRSCRRSRPRSWCGWRSPSRPLGVISCREPVHRVRVPAGTALLPAVQGGDRRHRRLVQLEIEDLEVLPIRGRRSWTSGR